MAMNPTEIAEVKGPQTANRPPRPTKGGRLIKPCRANGTVFPGKA